MYPSRSIKKSAAPPCGGDGSRTGLNRSTSPMLRLKVVRPSRQPLGPVSVLIEAFVVIDQFLMFGEILAQSALQPIATPSDDVKTLGDFFFFFTLTRF